MQKPNPRKALLCTLHLFVSSFPSPAYWEGAEGKGKNLLLVSLYFVILLFICVGKSADGKTVVGFPNDGWVGSLPQKADSGQRLCGMVQRICTIPFSVGAKGDTQKDKRHRGAVRPHPSPAAHYRSNPSPGKIPLGIETTPYSVRFCLSQA